MRVWMIQLTNVALPLVLGAGAALVSYLDAKFQLLNDLHFLQAANATSYIERLRTEDRVCSYYLFLGNAQKAPDRLFLIYEDGRTWTYSQFLVAIHRVGNWLINDLSIGRQEVVAVNFMNCPEDMMLCFALEAIGAAPAKINYRLTGAPLIECIKICKTRFMITDPEVEETVNPYAKEIEDCGTKLLYFTRAKLSTLDDETPIPDARRTKLTPDDIETVLFTSGTTGVPKATSMTIGRAMVLGKFMATFLKVKPTDRCFTCMPMYHGAAHCFSVYGVLYAGCTLVLSHQYSQKTFWPLVHSSGATHVQHVGQLCRYLLAAPPSPLDKTHKVKLLYGNLLRMDAWEKFRQRFSIPTIVEFYASSDGLDVCFNWNTGAFGRGGIATLGLISGWLMRKRLVPFKVDLETQELLRGKEGYCIRCAVNEAGEALSELTETDVNDLLRRYYDSSGIRQKQMLTRIIRNVVQEGDVWFRSSDMIRIDSDGVVYFVDRVVDAFRWRCKDISTNEVTDLLSLHPEIREVNVYGVKLPHHEERAGCAEIVPSIPAVGSFDVHSLARHASAVLDADAVPLFLRVVDKVETTGNLKLRKAKAREQGVDLERIAREEDGASFSMYWFKDGTYVPYRMEDWHKLKKGSVKL